LELSCDKQIVGSNFESRNCNKQQMKKILFILTTSIIIISCAVTHNTKDLIDFKTNKISRKNLKLDGYYYYQFESENNRNYNTTEKIKRINSIFIYDDGYSLYLSGIDGLLSYYCAEGNSYENSFENVHRNIELLVNAQKSNNKKIKKRCDFEPNYINHKGLTQIIENDNKIKIQYYQTEMQIPNKDSFNSYYLYEMNGEVKNDSTFVIYELKSYRTNKIENVNMVYKFRKCKKPELTNYFKKNI